MVAFLNDNFRNSRQRHKVTVGPGARPQASLLSDRAAWQPGTCQMGQLVRRPGGPPRQMKRIVGHFVRRTECRGRCPGGLSGHLKPLPLLRSLHWLPVKHGITYKTAVLTHKVLTTSTPPYLHDMLTVAAPAERIGLVGAATDTLLCCSCRASVLS